MHRLSGQCHCQAIQLELQLPQPPASYQPRACDCDFCRKHAAAYVSDPDGTLRIRARPGALGLYRQGSGKAQCVYCTHCGVLIGVMYEAVGHRYATVNVRVLDGEPGFADSMVVSPKALSAAEKVSRWKQLWCRGVAVEER